jgi:16S rRNA (cytosine1402-N4)-methyltransferase
MHLTVLLNEVVDLLRIKSDGLYVDATMGLGGHTEAIAKKLESGKILGLDVDPTHLERAESRLQPFRKLTLTRRVNFRGLQGVLDEIGWSGIDGLIADLGTSSVHLDTPERGFSFQTEGPLDMRLDPENPETALSRLQRIQEEELAYLLKEFGEHRQAKRVSRYLLHDIEAGKMKTTKDLAGFCERVLGRHGKTHPATRLFLALRVLVNDELGALKDLLEQAPERLNVNGRLAIISFHSLEDRIVKHRFLDLARSDGEKQFSVVTKKPVVPSDEETQANPRARSAKLRVLERTR